MTVVDGSAVLEVLFNTRGAAKVLDRISAWGETLHAPYLIDLEVAQVLRRFSATGEIDPGRGLEALQIFADLPLTRYEHVPLLPRIWELRHNLTVYDAAYVALAEALGAPLVTRDSKLAAFGGHSAIIELV